MTIEPDPRAAEDELLLDFFENAAVGLHWVAGDGTILRANQAELDLLGYTRDEYIGRHIADFHADAHAIADILERLSRGDTIHSYEARLRCKDGSIRHVLISSNVLRQGGKFVHTRCFTRDITPLKRAEQALRESEQLYRGIVERAHEGIWQLDARGRTRFANARMAQMLGATPEELRASSVEDFLDGEGAARIKLLRKRRREGISEQVELKFRRKDGGELWALVSAAPILDAEGRFDGILGLVFDLTERKRAERALLESEERLRDADRRKDEFLALLGHELRNPLAPLRNAVHILKMPGGDASSAQLALGMMERQLEHMVRLVDDLLDVSRIMRGNVELRREPVELATVIARAIELAQPLIEAESHTLAIAVPPEPLTVHGDLVRLSQVVSNLLNNAAKYTPRGGRIGISVERDSGDAVLRVTDNGVGVPPAMLPRIFDMFVQAERVTKNARGGLGIGLSLVRGFVELHGGTVTAASAGAGQGSAFTVRLPLMMGDAATSPTPRAATRPEAPAATRRVLVVDDNADAADSLAMLLRLEGQDASVAYDGASALLQAQAAPPALAFVDLGMPKMDGYELARAFRAHPELKTMKLVALTGWGQPEDRRRTREHGFDDHLVKPVDVDELRRLLAS